jgi:rubrerythrin
MTLGAMEAAAGPVVEHLQDPRYWLAHCEGFEVRDASGFLGWVEAVELDREARSARALLVNPSHVHSGFVRIPLRSVKLVAPDRGFVLVGSAGDADPDHRRTFQCAECGYGARGRTAPTRCPMCGGTSWGLFDPGDAWR